MCEEEDTGESNGVKGSISLSESNSMDAGATVNYTSGFPKKQLEYAKRARDKAGKIEVIFGGEDVLMVPEDEKLEHQQNVVSAVVNSLGFLEGQKYWFIYRLEEERWEFDNPTDIQETGWNGLEDAFVRMLEVCDRESGSIKGSKPYNEVKVLRSFRNDLLHFESPMVEAGEEADEYNIDEELDELNFPQNPVGVSNSYPFNWFSYELAERSVRMCFTLWRFFGRKLDKEEEFLRGVPTP